MFQGATQIRDAYRVEKVARAYIGERFTQPLGALLHERQAAALKRVVRELQPQAVLEVAPGPARLTTEAAKELRGRGVVIDASAQMLQEAERRLGPESPFRVLQGDAFNLPFGSEFDLLYTFRLIRHFDTEERSALYRQFARVLKPGGTLVFDAVNELVSRPLREKSPGEYRHYDAMYRLNVLHSELRAHGFEPVSFEGVQHGFPTMQKIQVLVGPRSRLMTRWMLEVCDRVPGSEPLEWIVTCRKA